MPDLQQLQQAILEGDADTTLQITQEALDAGTNPEELVHAHMIPAMDEVGRRFEEGEFFVPELLVAARAMKGALTLVTPILAQRGVEPVGKVVIGTVKGDLHDIGKNLVSAMLEGGGFHVVDLGVDVTPEAFIQSIKDNNVGIVALSALLTTTMPSMEAVIEQISQAGLRDKVKIVIGGAPITQEYADKIGADGYSSTASSAVKLVRTLIAA